MSQTDDLQQALKAIQNVLIARGVNVLGFDKIHRVETYHYHFYRITQKVINGILTTKRVTIKVNKKPLRSAGFRDWTILEGGNAKLEQLAMFSLYCRCISVLSGISGINSIHHKFGKNFTSLIEDAIRVKSIEVIVLSDYNNSNIRNKYLTMYSPDMYSEISKTSKEIIRVFYPALSDSSVNSKAIGFMKKAERIYDINCRSTVPTASENA